MSFKRSDNDDDSSIMSIIDSIKYVEDILFQFKSNLSLRRITDLNKQEDADMIANMKNYKNTKILKKIIEVLNENMDKKI